ncbi:hypothetical protein LAZ67_10001854 [Cordylochernes scorpioides]|uniref:Integrase catalytic domain-containing protein n=1 Tax=Cordylochernes scorpioides TaxID=51811 RepID=A0ABY6KYY1_9ARAC|nr:hypothetical protein LAZ67_10001854 [Cordylochernes scorpioides]
MEQKLKQRICIEFCVKLQISATETFEMLNKAFPNDVPKRTTVFEWHSRFKAGRISIEDDPRQKRPKFQRTDENLEQDTGISKITIGRIVTEDLKLKKTPAKFIPRFLTNEQKLCRLTTCDETWVYGYDPETKPQSAEWRGQTVIKEMYLGILRRLREAIRKKRPEKWTNGGWILHHDNARSHTAHLMTSFLAKNGTQILLQPPYFPDIAPNDFFLFPKLKAVLKGRHFDTRDDIIEKSPLALKSIPKEAVKSRSIEYAKKLKKLKAKKLKKPFVKGLKELKRPFVGGLKELKKPFVEGLKELKRPFVKGLKELKKPFVKGLKELKKPFVKGLKELKKPFVRGLKELKKPFVKGLKELKKPFVKGLKELKKPFVRGLREIKKPFVKGEMEDVSRRRREAIRGVFTEVVNNMNTELRDPLIDKSGIYAKFDRLESLHLELVALNERCQAILLAKDEATDDEIDKEFEDCEVYITERYYLKARIRVMREQDRDAQVKTSQIPPGASSASPNSETDNQKVIKLQTISTSLSKSPEEATDVKPALAKARILKEACSAPSIIDIEYEGKKGAVNAIKEKELNEAVKCNEVKDSETAVDSYVGVKEAEAKDKANEAEAKPDKVNSKDGDKGDQVKDSKDEPKGDGVKDSKDEPKGDGVKDSEDEPKGDGVNDPEARPTGDTESKIKNKGDLQKLKGNPGDWLSRGKFKDKEDSEAKPKGDGVKDSETAIKGYKPVSNSRAVAEGTDSKVEEEKIDAEQGTDSRVEENPDAEQGTESRMEEGIIDTKDWLNDGFIEGVDEIPPEGKGYWFPDRPVFGCESETTPIRPVCDGASCRGRSGLSLRRYLKKIPNLLRRIPEIGIKLRKNKYGVLADVRRYFQVMAIRENDWDYLRFLWRKKMDAYGATSEKLSDKNYLIWANRIESELRGLKLWRRIIEGEEVEKPIETDKNFEEKVKIWEDWDDDNAIARNMMNRTMNDTQILKYSSERSAKRLWNIIGEEMASKNEDLQMKNIIELSKLKMKEDETVDDYLNRAMIIKRKIHRKSYKSIQYKQSEDILDLWHTDIVGPLDESFGYKYFITIVDDYSNFTFVIPIANKSQTADSIINLIMQEERQTGKKVKRIRNDNGGEYVSNYLKRWLSSKGIKQEFTTAYAPESNGKAERFNRTIVESARTMLIDSKLPKKFGAKVLNREDQNLISHGNEDSGGDIYNREDQVENFNIDDEHIPQDDNDVDLSEIDEIPPDEIITPRRRGPEPGMMRETEEEELIKRGVRRSERLRLMKNKENVSDRTYEIKRPKDYQEALNSEDMKADHLTKTVDAVKLKN